MSGSLSALAALAGVVGNIGGAVLGQHYTRENMQRSYDLGQLAQRNSLLNYVHSAQAAGISPAVAAAGAGSAFSSPAGPSPSAGPVAQMPNFIDMANVIQNEKLVDAQADLMSAQTAAIDAQSGEDLSSRFALDEAARLFMLNEIKTDSKYAPAYKAILANQDMISGGTAKALRFWHQFLQEKDQSDAQAIANEFVNKVYELQKSNGAAKILSTMSHRDLQRFAMDLVKNNAEVGQMIANTNLSEAQLREVAAHTYQMLTDADFKYHKDFAAMWKNSDYSAAAASLFSSAVQSAAAGAGFYFGTKGLGTAGRMAKGKLAPTAKKGFDALYKTGFEGKKLGKTASPLKSLSQSQLNQRLLSYY